VFFLALFYFISISSPDSPKFKHAKVDFQCSYLLLTEIWTLQHVHAYYKAEKQDMYNERGQQVIAGIVFSITPS